MLTWLFTKTPLLFLTQSLWRDEAFSYLMAKKSFFEIIFLTAKDFNPPLYYLLLHYWMKIFGSSEIALRSLSMIFFWATTYVAFLFLNDIFKFKLKKSFFYLIFFIVNPLLLYYAFEARMYSMFAFFASLSYFSFYKKYYRLYLFSTIVGLFTHYFMLLVVFSQLFFLITNKENLENFKKIFIYSSLAVFSPWLVFFLSQNGLPGSFWLPKPNLQYAFGFFGILYTGIEFKSYLDIITKKLTYNVAYTSIELFLIVSIGIYFYFKNLTKKDRINFQLLFIWGVGISLIIGLISFIKPLYFPRYLIFTTFGFLLLLVFILEKMNTALRTIFIVLLVILTFGFQKLQLEYRKKTDLRRVLKEIQAIANKKDLIYTNDLDFFTAQYYFDKNRVYIYGKNFKDIPDYKGKVLITKENIASTLPLYPQKAFILDSYGKYIIQAMY